MQILLTNDDGINAEGIVALYQQLKKVGDVTVVAPDIEKSSVGHAITLSHPLWLKKVDRHNKFFGYGISGTPADCVKFGVKVILKQKPDLVVSGINLGPNDGCSVFYSGTVAGAREAALMGIPAFAISLNTFVKPDYRAAALFAVKLTKQIKKYAIPKGRFLNVNVPNKPSSKIKGVRITRQCMEPIHGTFSKRRDPNARTYYWMTGRGPTRKKDMRIDTYAVENDYITITPIQNDLTDYNLLNDLPNWA